MPVNKIVFQARKITFIAGLLEEQEACSCCTIWGTPTKTLLNVYCSDSRELLDTSHATYPSDYKAPPEQSGEDTDGFSDEDMTPQHSKFDNQGVPYNQYAGMYERDPKQPSPTSPKLKSVF